MIARLLVNLIVPLAAGWVARQERRISAQGQPLTDALRDDACRIGVREPDTVRLLVVDCMPWPVPRMLQGVAARTGLFSPHTIGLTMGHGIYLMRGHESSRSLIVHELAHTAQYERLGGIRPFLKAYLLECLMPPGYPFGPLEQEAVRAGNGCGWQE